MIIANVNSWFNIITITLTVYCWFQGNIWRWVNLLYFLWILAFYLVRFVFCNRVQHNMYNALICLHGSKHNCKSLCSIEFCSLILFEFDQNHQCLWHSSTCSCLHLWSQRLESEHLNSKHEKYIFNLKILRTTVNFKTLPWEGCLMTVTSPLHWKQDIDWAVVGW